MSFQVGNVFNPNKPQNTVIFSILEAKDYKTNLLLSLERFKTHVLQFSKMKWQGKDFRLFLFGDYAFLCNMYGISGASGRHPCLWCHIPSDALCIPRYNRLGLYKLRSLVTLETYNRDLKKAKFAFNVIEEPYFPIPLEQVCIPGLYITLGVYLLMLNYFEIFAMDIDLKMAYHLALRGENVTLREVISTEQRLSELGERRNLVVEEFTYFALTQSVNFEEYHKKMLAEIDEELDNLKEQLTQLREIANLGMMWVHARHLLMSP